MFGAVWFGRAMSGLAGFGEVRCGVVRFKIVVRVWRSSVR